MPDALSVGIIPLRLPTLMHSPDKVNQPDGEFVFFFTMSGEECNRFCCKDLSEKTS